MKKIFVVLAVVMIAAPTWAAVTITCTQGTTAGDCNEVTVSYSVTGPNSVRAFALDVTVSSGEIVDVIDASYNVDYNVYPGSIQISGGVVTGAGSPVGDPCNYSGTLGGEGTGGATMEMGSLYEGENGPNAITNPVLFKFIVSESCTVDVNVNPARGGVVMENPDENPGLVSPGVVVVIPCGPTDCMCIGHTDYSEWVDVNKPDSWCWDRQCHGDADNAPEKIGKAWYHVAYNDLGVLVDGWKLAYGGDPDVDTWINGDVDHAPEKIGKAWYRVAYNDLGVLVDFWKLDVDPNCISYECP